MNEHIIIIMNNIIVMNAVNAMAQSPEKFLLELVACNRMMNVPVYKGQQVEHSKWHVLERTRHISAYLDCIGVVWLQGVSDVVPIAPRKGDRLRILEGSDAGGEGELSSLNGYDAVVKLSGTTEEIVIVPLSSTGRLND